MFFGGGGTFTTFSMGGRGRDPFASKYCTCRTAGDCVRAADSTYNTKL